MSSSTAHLQTCKSCGNHGTGKFCNHCGQAYATKRISFKSLLHDVFHFFTHLEKGFGYTVKQLIIAPGTMQREYVEGKRSMHQKPFSLFFICISINAIARYFIFEMLAKYFHRNTFADADYFHQYQLFLYLVLVPLMSALTWLFFLKGKYNFAEITVSQLYSFSFILLLVIPIGFLKFIWYDLDTAYVELPLISIYSVITFTSFFKNANWWLTAVKGLVVILLLFFIVQKAEDIIIDMLKKH
ncbi:MAG: hypothetical protein JWQ30_2623 [Sediminibacterium sp.]|nr:hypothetical protein [Sediminibacterium sp.]